MTLPAVECPRTVLNALPAGGAGLPAVDAHTTAICADDAGLAGFLAHPAVTAVTAQLCRTLERDGFAVLDLTALSPDVDLDEDKTLLTALLCGIGDPIRVFLRHPLWKPLPTSLEIDPWRATGVGYIPFHIDFVNAERPPDYTCLFVVRADPAGGGHSLVSDLARAVDELPSDDRAFLQQREFRDGAVQDLQDVGGDVNPFAVLDERSPWRFRFTAKPLYAAQLAGRQRESIARLEALLQRHQRRLPLKRHQLLIVDQRRAVHGREALGPDQAGVPEHARRLAQMIFLRRRPTVAESGARVEQARATEASAARPAARPA